MERPGRADRDPVVEAYRSGIDRTLILSESDGAGALRRRDAARRTPGPAAEAVTDFGALLATHSGRHEVAFVVVGGAAAIAHGSARADYQPYVRGEFHPVTSLGDIDLPGEIPGGGT